MAVSFKLKSASLSAIAVALALAAMPAQGQAQDQGGRYWRGEARPENGMQRPERTSRGEGAGQQRGWSAQRSAPSPQQPSIQPRMRGGDGADGARTGWQGRGRAERQGGNDRPTQGWGSSARLHSQTGANAAVSAPAAATPRARIADNENRKNWQSRGERRGDWQNRRDNEGRDDRWQNNQRSREVRDGNRNWWGGDRLRDNDRRRDNYRDADRSGWRDRDHRNWNRNWRQDNRYDWHSWRNANRQHYRPGRYYAPYRNYHYRRLSIGFYLDNLFFSSRYWIDDPWSYRLPDAYGPYRWVRYYDDALLVDIYSGEVIDVIHDFFW